MIPFFLAYFIEGKTVRSVVYGWLQSHIWEGSMRGIGPLRMLDRTFYLYFFACFFPVLFSPILFFSYFFSRIFFPVLFFPRMFFPYFFPYFFFRTSFRIFFLACKNDNFVFIMGTSSLEARNIRFANSNLSRVQEFKLIPARKKIRKEVRKKK
jgi:hypothetical protein